MGWRYSLGQNLEFADSVYEVVEVRDGRLVDISAHLNRLNRSLGALAIPRPMSDRALRHIIQQTVLRNHVSNGLVYLQISRGASARDFLPPEPDLEPTVVCLARAINPTVAQQTADVGIGVITMPDIRWGRCDIKTVMLLPACLAKASAQEKQAKEAWFLDTDDFITEGGSSNAWIIDAQNSIITRPTDSRILSGITRETTIRAIEDLGYSLQLRAFSKIEAYAAKEAFVTAASSLVLPVVKIDNSTIGTGVPGEMTRRLRTIFHAYAEI